MKSLETPPAQRLARLAPIGFLALGFLVTTAACPGTSSSGNNIDEVTTGAIDFEAFSQDKFAIGGDWYIYDEEAGHVLTPNPEVYIFEDRSTVEPRYAAIRLITYYDPNTAESGVFTFEYSVYDNGAWSTKTSTMSHNIKAEGAFCYNFFDASEKSCSTSTDWQMQLRTYRFFVQTGPIVVTRPGVFLQTIPLADGTPSVRVATVQTTSALEDLGSPTTLGVLDDVEPEPDTFGEPSFDRSLLSPDKPRAGHVIGTRLEQTTPFGVVNNIYYLQSATFEFIAFWIERREGNEAVTIHYNARPLDLASGSIALDAPRASSDVFVSLPAVGEVKYVAFRRSDLEVDELILAEAVPPNLPPQENEWDLALEWVEGSLSVRVSSASAVYNATQAQGIDELPLNLDDATKPPER